MVRVVAELGGERFEPWGFGVELETGVYVAFFTGYHVALFPFLVEASPGGWF